jgi:hypothetical protein
MLILTKTSDTVRDLTYRGCDTPSFYYTPSCFSLMINNYALTNISSPFLLSKDLGLPYPVDAQMTAKDRVEYSIAPGSEKLGHPKFAQSFPLSGTRLYQANWKEISGLPRQQLYDTPYIRSVSLNHEAGMGSIFLTTHDGLVALSDDPDNSWVPETGPNTVESRYLLSRAILNLQTDVDALAPNLDSAPEAERQHFSEVLRSNREWNTKKLEELSERWNDYLLSQSTH